MTLQEDCARTVPPVDGLFSPDHADKIIKKVARGMPLELAGRMWRVKPDVLKNWIATNPEFEERIEQAKAQHANFIIGQMNQNRRNHASLARTLQSRYPEYFPAKKTDVNEPVPVPPVTDEYNPARGLDLAECNRWAKAQRELEERIERENLVWDSPSQSFIPRTTSISEESG